MRRCLHVVESLNRNAVETWLVRMLSHARQKGIELDWTFYCLLDEPGSLEAEVAELGADAVRSPVSLSSPLEFTRSLRREINRGGYEILHGHHDIMNSFYLLASLGTSVSTRVCHVHNADETIPTSSETKKFLTREPMRQVCLNLADKIVGISQHTLDTFLRGRARRPGRDTVHYYGVDPAPFQRLTDARARIRHELAIPNDALVILFASRLAPEKNPIFAVDVIADARRKNPNIIGVFAGTGSEEQQIRARLRELGIDDAVRMLGWRGDLPDVMKSADCFLLPRPDHPMEGFGLAVVEAQLAGLRLLLSDGIADDPLLPSAVFERLSVTAGADRWGTVATRLLHRPPPQIQEVFDELEKSPMNMDRALDGLLSLYRS